MAQRLVRTLCPHCKVEDEVDLDAWALLTHPFKAKPPSRVYWPRGCLECRDTGFLGRMGIYELLPMTDRVKGLVTAAADVQSMRREGMKEGMRTLRLSGAQKVGAGLTTIAEVLRVAPASED
jgi:general secretion pathway protein E